MCAISQEQVSSSLLINAANLVLYSEGNEYMKRSKFLFHISFQCSSYSNELATQFKKNSLLNDECGHHQMWLYRLQYSFLALCSRIQAIMPAWKYEESQAESLEFLLFVRMPMAFFILNHECHLIFSVGIIIFVYFF
ncbi:hypothetical protein DERP_000129 [Dermatophagoides pteronyssinus]|uniref:Uncharacterized protein n=1 Tax=Dermatophagoides pteronyssinus TaxID=6956 RepID=A0ABQ8IZA5_DERPT|nr:hypothetical protein DERP_000129 [Dermatophagoides pteronyssinus]